MLGLYPDPPSGLISVIFCGTSTKPSQSEERPTHPFDTGESCCNTSSISSIIRYLLTLKILSNPKHPYSNPTGYATSSFWWSIRRTATKIDEAEYVHQRMERMAKT